jgi:multimeric flavodoxin WrbA
MGKKLILHDLTEKEAGMLPRQDDGRFSIFPASPAVRHCIGCFGCWVKTPGRCVIPDRGGDFAALMARHDELIVVSRLVFGGFSPDVKAVLDRSIGFVLPFFRTINREMHHAMRYEKSPDMRCLFYGEDMSRAEKSTAEKLVAANALNFGANHYATGFYPSIQEIGGVLL